MIVALAAGLAAVAIPAHGVGAQQGTTLHGRVVEAGSREAVAGAEVVVRSTQLRTLTGPDGRFTLELPPGPRPVRLLVAAAGYATIEHETGTAGTTESPVPANLLIALERLPFEVPGLTVTANRGNALPGEAPVSVTVMSGDELGRRSAATLDEALPFAQGVTFNAGQMDIRGASGIARGVGSRVLMLLNGHRVLTGVGSAIDFGLLPTLDVERIEIVKGPHSTLFGTNALGGVVNVITRPPVAGPRTIVQGWYGLYDTPANLEFGVGLLDMRGLRLQHERRVGPVDAAVMAGWEGTDGFRQNGHVERWQLGARSVVGAESARPLELFVNFKREDAEEFFTWASPERPLEVDPAELGDWVRETDLVAGMTATPVATSTLRLQLRPQIQHVRSQNHFHDNSDFHHSTRYGTDIQLSRTGPGRHSLTGGAEASRTRVSSNFLEPDPVVTDLALFVHDEIAISQRLQVTAGLRADLHGTGVSTRDLALNPRVGFVLNPSPRLSLRTSLSRGYRAPSVSEQFTATTVFGFRVVPNLELRGESAWAGEVGLTASPHARLRFDGALFWSEYDGLIEVATAPDQLFTFQFRNVAGARVRGLDLGAQLALVPGVLNAGATWLVLDALDEGTGRSLPYRSRHNATATLSAWEDRVALDLRYRSRADQVLAYPLDERGDATIVDLRLGRSFGSMDIRVRIANLLQARYVDVQERNPGASRSVRITVTSRR